MFDGRFSEIITCDTEFTPRDGERPELICLVAHEKYSGRKHRFHGDDLLRCKHPPFPHGPDTLFVAYYSIAELSCFRVLGWPSPANILDLFVEFRNKTNGLWLPHGNKLLSALAYHRLPAMAAVEKERMHRLCARGGPYTPEEYRAIVDYCEEDVDALDILLPAMAPSIDIDRAVLRGRYMAAAATIEDYGIPIDIASLERLTRYWEPTKRHLIREVDANYHCFIDGSFNLARWQKYLTKKNIAWPTLPTGHLKMDKDTSKDMAMIHPELLPMHELRQTLSQLRLNELAVGSDGRNRFGLSAFRSRTGRNQPSNSKSIFGPSKWLRSLIQPPEGYAIAYIDFAQQELGIAAALSEDPSMMAAYKSGDFYLAFARMAGAPDPKAVREIYKTCTLGIIYSMGAQMLAYRTGLYLPYAQELLERQRRMFPKFWEWSDRVVNYAMLHKNLHTAFDWNLWIEKDVKSSSLQNFPMQANASEILRLACSFAVERGVRVIAPVHDALLIEAKVGQLVGDTITTSQAMKEASRVVLGNFELRTDVKTFCRPFFDRYIDKKGWPMWLRIQKIIAEIEGRRR